MVRRHIITPPHREWNYQYELRVQVDWAKNCAGPFMAKVASCPTEEAIEAARRLLIEEEE